MMVYKLLNFIFQVVYFALIARVFLSWIPHDTYHPIIQFIHRITDPLLRPFRGLVQFSGIGFDLSPIFAFLALGLIQKVVYSILF